ncbi:MAG: GEVED domain-containing protein, partial [Chitinophagaceae bacterium]
MKKACLRVVLVMLTTFLSTMISFQAQAQLSYSYNFLASGTSGWSGNGARTTTSVCATTGSIRYNLYSSLPTMNFMSPALNSSQGSLVTLSYQTKCINYSGGAGANANSVTTKVQYSSSSTGPWTDVAGSSFGNTNATTCTTRTVSFTPPSGTFYVRFNSVWSTGDVWLYLDEISITAPAPQGCTGTPVPGNTITSATSVCSGVNFDLSIQNSMVGSGITYQWESADDLAFTTNVTALGTASTQTTSSTTSKYYRCGVTCAGNGTGYSTPALVQVVNNPALCAPYCVPVGSCAYGDLIAQVSLNTLNNVSGTTCSGAYVNYTASTNPSHTTTLLPSSTYNCSVKAGAYDQDYAAWIDYNDDGVFDASERIGFTSTTLAANATASFPITLACTPPAGQHRLRVRSAYNTPGSTITPCGSQTYGETEDYIITIAAPPACPDPGLLSVVSTTYNSANLSWVLNCATATEWDVQYGPSGFTIGNGTILSNIATINSTTISGLNSTTAYDFYVRANCGVGGVSNWSLVSSGTTLQAPCTGTPPMALVSTSSSICSGTALPLTASGTSTDIGITYQWETSLDSISWAPLAGATTSSYTLAAGISVPTWFRLVTTCTNSTLTSVSNEIGVTINPFYHCYAASTATNTANEEILRVTIDAGSNSSNCASVGPGPGSVLNLYSNYRTLGALTSLEQGGGYPITLDLGSCAGDFARAAKVWIDFNQNGIFENPAEMVYSTGNIAASTVNPTSNNGTILIPLTANIGTTGMRVSYFETTEANIVPTGTPSIYGEVEDYLVNITPLNTVITSVTPTSACANVGNIVITGSGLFGATAVSVGGTPVNSYVVNSPTQITAIVSSGTSGYVSVTNNGLTAVSADSITIIASPVAPNVSPASVTVDYGQTTSIVASGTESIFNWYTTASGGTSIHTGASFTTPDMCSSTVYYVEQNNGTCAGIRTAVAVDVNPLVLSVTPANALICSASDSATMSVNSIPGAIYAWSNNTNGNAITVSPGITTAYTVSVSSASCSTVFTQNIGVISGVNLAPSVASSSFCYPGQISDSLYSNLSAGNFGVNTINYNPSTEPATGVTTLATGGAATTPLSGGSLDDGGWGGIPIGFDYNFFGSNFNNLGVGTNGLVMFGSIPGYGTNPGQLGQFSFSSPAFPNAGNPGNVIGLMLSDMNFGTATSSLRYWTEGVAPTRKFVLSGTYAQYSGGALSTVQLHLYETTGIVEVHIASSAATTARTIGLQDATKTIGALAPGWNGRTTTLTTPQSFRFSPPANYTYSWNTTNNNVTPTSSTDSKFEAIVSAPGNYTYTLSVTNPNTGCVLNETVNFSANETPIVSVSNVNNVTCYDGNNGSATVSINGGTAPFTYNWAPTGGSTETASNLVAGEYTVTVTDAGLCSVTTVVSISQPSVITPTLVSTTPVSCNGGSNGDAVVFATGGTGNYTYNWLPYGGTSNTASGLGAGTYTVTVSDDSLCSQSITVSIIEPVALSASVNTLTGVSCFGGNDGMVSMDVNGGTAPYTYSWTPSGGTTNSASNLIAGDYTFTVIDANNCISNTIVSITEPAVLSINLVGTDITCNGGANGTATANISGGTPGYTYSWTGLAATTAGIDNLYAGTYAVTVTDSKQCSATASVTLLEADPLVINLVNSFDVTCYGANNGAATVLATGGSGIYSYAWSPAGGNASSANGLSAGLYTVTVTDGNGCSNSNTVAIFEPNPFTASITSIAGISCYGSASASATATANGGVAPYTYSWSPLGGNDALAGGLMAGVYTITITDANLCTATSTIEFTEPSILSADVTSVTHVSCYGSADGYADIMSTGGTSPYTYSWSPSLSNSSSASGLSAGIYTITVTDFNNCSATTILTIMEPDAISISVLNVVDASCFGASSGSAEVSVTGGSLPYSYSWSPYGGNSEIAGNLSAGVYTVSVSDNNNCSSFATVTIAEPTELMLTASSLNPLCNGGNGELQFSANGGTGTISYEVNGLSASSPYSVSDGTYTVVAIDANACSTQNILTVTQPDVLSLSVNASDPLCSGGDGIIDFSALGGTNSLTFTVNGLPASSPYNAIAGTYTIEVMDGNGCSASSVVTLIDPAAITISTTVYDALCNGGDGIIDFSASGGNGFLSYTINNDPNVGSPYNAIAGTYTIIASDANGCSASSVITVNEPSAISVTASSIDAGCNGGLGEINFSAIGGAEFFQFTVDGNYANSPTSVVAGTYTIVATDLNGCSATTSVAVSEPSALALTVTVNNATCNGANGSLSMSTTGGAGNYGYTVNGNFVTNPFSTLAGIYTIVVTDANGCSVQTIETISEQSAIVLNTTLTDATCFGGNGTINFIGTGGAGNVTYTVNGISETSPYTATAGSYTVMATDANGCTSLLNVTINEPAAIQISATSTDALCNGGNGEIAFSAQGGNGTISVTVNGNSASTPFVGTAGIYNLVATDANACSAQTTVTINEPLVLDITALATDALCNGQNGSIEFSSTGGTGTVQYLVNGLPATSPYAASTGTFTVTAIDANACSAETVVTVSQPSSLSVSATVYGPFCNGADGVMMLNASGGTGYLSFSVDNVPTYSPHPAPAGMYTLVVTDANNCSASTTVIVNEPDAIVLSATSTDALCNASNGSIDFSAIGGTGPISFTVNTLSASSPMSVPAGTYQVVATDFNGCTVQTSLLVAEPSALNLSVSAFDAPCNGQNGELIVSGSGGTGNITYTVNGLLATNNNILPAGNYTVVGTDANACSAMSNVTINEPMPLLLTASSSNALCNGSNGSILFSASGGTGTVAYQVNGTTAVSPYSAAVGTYTISATDLNGCSAQTTLVIAEPTPVSLIASATNALCNGTNGSINFVASGGTGTITYMVNGNSANSNMSAPVGNYIVTATDANGCTAVSSVSITAPISVVLTASATNALCNGANGNLSFAATGGTGTIAYTVNGTAQTSPFATTAGTYTIVATDVNGCSSQLVRTITQPTALVLSASANAVVCAGGNGSLVFSGTGGTGTKIFTVNGVVRNSPATVQAGTYTVAITDANGCVSSTVITVNTINALPTVSLGADVTICQGGSTNLSLSFTGNAPWTYTINGGAPQVTSNNPKLISVNPVISTQYIITSLSDATCSNSITDSIWVNTQPCGNLMPLITSNLTHQVTYKTAASTYTVTATNTPTSYAATGLPSGLNFATATGIISGTATALPGVYPVQISAYNQYGSDTKTLFLTVNPRQLTITGISALAKVYDGTSNASITGVPSLVGKASGDIVNVGGTPSAQFNNRNAGNGKPVTCSGYVLTGTHAAYYSLTQPVLTASISKRTVSITGITALSKVFDGNTSTGISGTAVANNLIAGDSVALNTASAVANFTSPNYGYNKAVIFSGYSLIGADALNYNLNQPANGLANIICAPVSITNIVASGNKATVSWPAGSLQYVIEYRLANTNNAWTAFTTSLNSRVLTGLTASTTYEVRLKASCVAGMFSDYTNTTFTTTSGCDLPVLQAPIVNGNSAKVSWTSSADSIYQFSFKLTSAVNWGSNTNLTVKNRTMSGLTINTSYDYRVRSICKNGDVSVWVEGQFTTTSGCGLPSLNAPVAYGNSANVSWNGSSDSIYQVSFKTLNSNTWTGPFITSTLNRTLTNLNTNTTYQYQVRSICKNGDISNFVLGQFTTTSGCGLAVINNVSPITGNSATINWSGTSDSIYQVSVRVMGTNTWPVATNTPNQWFKANNLLVSTTYQYQIRSVCKNGDASA